MSIAAFRLATERFASAATRSRDEFDAYAMGFLAASNENDCDMIADFLDTHTFEKGTWKKDAE